MKKQPRKAKRVVYEREQRMYVAGMVNLKIYSKYSVVVREFTRVDIEGWKKKAIMTLTTTPTDVPGMRRDMFGISFNSKSDKNYTIVRLRTGKLMGISIISWTLWASQS